MAQNELHTLVSDSTQACTQTEDLSSGLNGSDRLGSTSTSTKHDTPPLASVACDASVYLHAARAWLPHWIRAVGVSPWFDTRSGPASAASLGHADLHHRQAATLAIAQLREIDAKRSDRDYLGEVVRTSLTHWQLSLQDDGRPRLDRSLPDACHPATASSVVTLLSETSGFEKSQLLGDVKRHLEWLAHRRRPSSPWLEAALIRAMAEGAVLLSDPSLRDRARTRLAPLLEQQEEEGWFREPGGFDLTRLSHCLDSLARVYRLFGFPELEQPLQRALRIMTYLVHPDDTVCGGGPTACDPIVLAPYGLELLAPHFADAVALALVARRQLASAIHASDGVPAPPHQAIGASVALAASYAAPNLRTAEPLPHNRRGRTRLERAGLTIFSTETYHAIAHGRRGGAISVAWRNGAPNLQDPGVSVAFPNSTLRSAIGDRRCQESVTDTTVTSSGILRRVNRPRHARWKQPWRRITRWLKHRRTPSNPKLDGKRRMGSKRYHNLAHDYYNREVTFDDTSIRIRDHVHCRLRCHTVICQSPPPDSHSRSDDSQPQRPPTRPPIFMDGGRNVVITRVYRDGELVTPTEPRP